MKVKPAKCRFSYNLSKGSVAQREHLAEQINLKIFNKIIPLYSDKSRVPLRVVERRFRTEIPEHKPITIKKITDKNCGYAGILETTYSKAQNEYQPVGYILKINAPDNLLAAEDVPNFIHESTHFLDRLLQPKYAAIDKKLFNSNLYTVSKELFLKYYYKNLYSKGYFSKNNILNYIKKQTLKNLQNYSDEDKLNILNFIKLQIMLEIHAYKQTLQYYKEIFSKVHPKFVKIRKKDIESYIFEDKLNLINTLIYKEIQNQRAKNIINNSTKTKDKIFAYMVLLKNRIL